jgi:CBS domain-containing protein
MKVSEIMRRDVATCAPSDRADVAVRIMVDRDCGAVPVVDSTGAVLGILTDRDVCLAGLSSGKPLEDVPVDRAMSVDVICCSSDDSIEEAEERMGQARVRRLPVVDESRRLVGLLSLDDIARAVLREELQGLFRSRMDEEGLARTLAAICRRRMITET